MISFNSFLPAACYSGALPAPRCGPMFDPCEDRLHQMPPSSWMGGQGCHMQSPTQMMRHRHHHHRRDGFSDCSPAQGGQPGQPCGGDFLSNLSQQEQKRQQAFERLTQMGFTKVGLNIVDKAGHQVARGPGGFEPNTDAPFCPCEFGIGQALADKGLNASCWIRSSDGMQVVVSPDGDVRPVSLTTRP